MEYFIQDTPQKTNMEAENDPLEKEQHLLVQTMNFWVLC